MSPVSLAFLIVTISYSLDALPFKLHPKIVGGTPASPREFPYQVSLQAFNNFESIWDPICGGIIINSTTILSAAHCVLYNQRTNKDVTKFRVIAGEYNLEVREDSEQERLVESALPHPDWDSFNYRNDIGLYVLSEPLMFNDWVQPMKLPPKGHVSTGNLL
jgi:secreted trypsin-like serine protease